MPSSAGNRSVDDVPAISKALSTCGDGGTIVILAGKLFMIRSALDFRNCSGCTFQIEGTLKVSDDLAYWEGRTAVFTWQHVTGTTIRSVTGSRIIDGSGQVYWNYFAKNNTYRRLSLVYFTYASNVIITNIKLKDPPNVFVDVKDGSANNKFSDLVLSAVSTSDSQPLNTDGFYIGEYSYVTLNNIHATNDDDGIAFVSGANYISVHNITCVGSHGLSVGGLGLRVGVTYEVKNVYVSNATMINSSKAVGIKLYAGGPSYGTVFVSNITFERVTVNNCDYAFQVQTCYFSNKTIFKDYPSAARLSNRNLIDIIGRTSKTFDPNVANINCPGAGTCDLTFLGWNNIFLSGNSTVLCGHYDHPSGVTCTPGAFG